MSTRRVSHPCHLSEAAPTEAVCFVQAGVPRSKLVVIPESVDCELFDPTRHTRQTCPPWDHHPADGFAFLSVGKWEERKGFEDLVRTCVRGLGVTRVVRVVQREPLLTHESQPNVRAFMAGVWLALGAG